jgi:acetate---CoA ligase (ADP-forming)
VHVKRQSSASGTGDLAKGAETLMKTPHRENYGYARLKRLIDPRVIAVIGASETPGSFGMRTLANLADFGGSVYAVNPRYESVMGRPCVRYIEDLPESPDCVVMCIARDMVEPMLEGAGKVRAGGAIVYASGYTETGKAERIELQARLVEVAMRTGVRVAGPNCVGIANTRLQAGLNFMPDYGRMGHKRGPIAIVSQSGALGYTVLQGMTRGIGFSKYLAAGNSADVDVCDYLSYLAEDDDTEAVVCLFEGIKDGRRLISAGKQLRQAGKALIVYKAGNSDASRKAALSHTGTMAGSSAAYQAAFDEIGAIATDDLEATLELASFFTKSKAPPSGSGAGVLATSGGAAVICADKASEHRVALPELSNATKAALNEVVPDFGSVANPSDLTAEVLKTSETFGYCLDAFAADPSFSSLVIPMVFAHPSSSGARSETILAAARRTDKPIAVVWMNEWLDGPGSDLIERDHSVSLFRSADRCFAALKAWERWHSDAQTSSATSRLSPTSAADVARAILARSSGPALSESDSKSVLSAYGISVPREEIAESPAVAANAAEAIGFPVAVKIASQDIGHKTEVGGIALHLGSRDDVQTATASMLSRVKSLRPDARITGVSVQEMVPEGVEIVVGATMDAQFGPLVIVGLGGVLVELMKDTAVALAPLTKDRAKDLVKSLKGYGVLQGFRGRPAADINGIADIVCRLSEMMVDLGDSIGEVDVNPVIALGDKSIAADALIIRRLSNEKGTS